MNTPDISRRSFLKSVSIASAAVAFPYVMKGQGGTSPNNKLNIACVGAGGRGKDAVAALEGENLVAFCDVDEHRAAATYHKHPGVPTFQDFREMFDKLGNQIDAVTVSTPDHMHFPVAMAAVALGKHVFVEKPLTHTLDEARKLAAAARGKKIATQMGNEGHATDGIRTLKEWIDAGTLGDVREVHCWTDRPADYWTQGNLKVPDHSKFIPVVPGTLNWDLWLGVAQERPYDPAYLPAKWRGYWDFGCGALGDMGCHILDGVHWALKLDAPSRIEAISALSTDVGCPSAEIITFQFPERGAFPPLKLTWYDSGLQPPPPEELEAKEDLPDNGVLIVGSKATALATLYYQSVRIIPETKMQAMTPSLPPKTIPRIKGEDHFAEWVSACKGGPAAGSNFDISSRLTELCHLGNIAVRARRPIEWDSAAMKITNLPSANEFITSHYRPGFGV